MKLERLRIERLAGIDAPFELEKLSPGLNIIVGPNGIGKSRLCTAVRALLWREREVSGEGLTARADFEHEGSRWQVVRDGSLHRWQKEGLDASPPTLPGLRLEGCFFLGLRDLLEDSDRAGRDLATEIRKQMSGGFDLDAAEQRFAKPLSKSAGKKESKALNAAEQEIRKAERGQIDLERRGRALASLEARAVEAERASQRLAAFATAISLQSLRADHAQRTNELAEFPPALADLDGKEIQRLDKLSESLLQKKREREAAIGALDASVEAARATRLDAPIDSASLETWRERADKLTDLERRMEAAKVAAAQAREAFRERLHLLGGFSLPESLPESLSESLPESQTESSSESRSEAHSDTPPEATSETKAGLERALGIEEDFDLFAFLRESHQHADQRDALRERLSLLSARKFSDEDVRRLELLRRGVEPLRRWLRAPDPDLRRGGEVHRPDWRILAAAALGSIALGLTTNFLGGLAPFAWIAIGAGLGLAIAALFFRARGPGSDPAADATNWRSVAESQFPESLDPPKRWAIDAVEQSLTLLEDELAKFDANEKRARDRGVERGQLEETLNGLKRRLAGLETRRIALFERLGLASMPPDVEMVDLARALDASRTARVASVETAATLGELEAHYSRSLAELAEPLAERGERAPVESASARAAVHSLADRDRRLRSASADEAREIENRDRLDREIAGLEADRSEIFGLAGIESKERAELTRLLGRLDRFRELTVELSKLVGAIEREESDLEAVGEAALAGLGLTKLQEEEAVQQKRSEDRKALNAQIVEIRLEARNARLGHVLEEAIAERDRAMVALRDRRDEALAASAAQGLIESVRREHETNQMPRVLERARNRFAGFTHQRYRLEVSPGDGGSFVAVDMKSGEGLSLNKLSDGTRAQLILAARLAFAEEAEHGADLPLFLDEAMDHSDPERFHAIAVSLAGMVGEAGRQIFYLTNDPTDIERFASAFEEAGCEGPNVLDLAEIRGQASKLDGLGRRPLRVDPLPAVPPPGDQDAETYGATIGVSPLDPGRDASTQPLYYVLRDDLSLLHRFLEMRIKSVGPCLNLLEGGSALARSITRGGEIGAGLEARIELLDVFCVAWREGRGVPVGRLELEESEAITETYLDAVVEVASELDGDAQQLLARLRERKDPRLSGFRSKSTEALEQFFLDRGHLDDRAMLSEDEIIQRAVGTPASNRLSPKVTAELVHLWWTLSDRTRSGAPRPLMG